MTFQHGKGFSEYMEHRAERLAAEDADRLRSMHSRFPVSREFNVYSHEGEELPAYHPDFLETTGGQPGSLAPSIRKRNTDGGERTETLAQAALRMGRELRDEAQAEAGKVQPAPRARVGVSGSENRFNEAGFELEHGRILNAGG